MTVNHEPQLRLRIRLMLIAFVIGLLLSGLTAFPLRWEINSLARFMGATPTDTVQTTHGLLQWVVRVREGLNDGYGRYPFLAYGTDWLAFGHIVIALAFIGPLRDPVRNIWIIEWAMIACVGVIPLALICGPIRDIPFFHQLIDCSFGVVGIIPLWICRSWILRLAKLNSQC
jgi:hypothetical protein